jgi:AhpD family alkylhydroperoxidase
MAIRDVAADTYRRLLALSGAVELDSGLRDLINVRVSQINGCVYCLDTHSSEAREHGERQARLDTLPAWREAPYFTARERAALALTEAVTLVASTHVPDEAYDEAARWFDEQELAQVLFAIIVMNSWNRVAISTRMAPATR